MKRGNMPQRKAEKKSNAADRQKEYDSLSTEDKVSKLDKTLGVGIGASKQRCKLRQTIEVKSVEIPVKEKSTKKNKTQNK